MKMVLRLSVNSVIMLVSIFRLQAQTGDETFIRGGDMSVVPQIESLGGKYTLNGVQTDALDIMKQNGMNYVRLRIWHTPDGSWCGLGQTVAYAQRVKAKGFKFLLDFHYSDWWADPATQNKPAAWASASFTALKESVYTYTKYVVRTLKECNALPDMVQIGNEITPGMLWPDGRNNTAQGWTNFSELLKEGIRGAKEAAADQPVRIMIHIDRGGDNATARWFYDNLVSRSVPFDVIGLSYYPWWHGSLAQLKNNLNDLAVRYNKPIVLAETAYPWTTQSLNDGHGNIGVNATTLPKGYPVSPQGQKAFLAAVTKIVKETVNNKGLGYFYWEPAYISVSPIGSAWEHLTTFDFSGGALSSINAFLDLDSLKKIVVTLRVNTSTVWDTLKTDGVVQIRGEVIGKGSSLLPGGELVSWGMYTQLLAKNIGGSYWENQFKMYEGDQLEYKFWTGHTAAVPTHLRLGYEGPVAPSEISNRNIRLIVAGTNDTTLDLQYYNSSGVSQWQYWSPIPKKQDTIGVLFRVNMADLQSKGQFDPVVNGPVAVRGDSAESGGVLSWNANNVTLQRETLSVGGGTFWSGVAYFAKNTAPAGTVIKYKFYAANSPFDGWESGIADRVVTLPTGDTTLSWKFFNERRSVTGVREGTNFDPAKYFLDANYPNPFNASTTIRYLIARSSHVTVTVVNLLGQPVRVLADRPMTAGGYSVVWDGTDESGVVVNSGIYFVKLTADNFAQVRKMILLK